MSIFLKMPSKIKLNKQYNPEKYLSFPAYQIHNRIVFLQKKIMECDSIQTAIQIFYFNSTATFLFANLGQQESQVYSYHLIVSNFAKRFVIQRKKQLQILSTSRAWLQVVAKVKCLMARVRQAWSMYYYQVGLLMNIYMQ